MSDLSRRNFFRRFFPTIDARAGRQLESESVCLGGVGGFPVGANTEIRWRGRTYFLTSEPEGFRIQSADGGTFFGLLLSKGQIFFRPQERWPKQAVLSVITGEKYNVEGDNCG